MKNFEKKGYIQGVGRVNILFFEYFMRGKSITT